MTRRDAFEALFDLGGTNVDSDILIEASIPLELSGEAVRGRICTFTDEAGKEWALRPDLTLPVAMAEVEARRGGVSGAHVRRYRGPVFRLPALPGEPVEYDQIGLERFGFKSDWEEDVRMVDALVKACRAEGVSGGVMRCGDLSIFPAIVDALGLSEDTANGLKRAFRQEGGVRAYLKGQDAQDTTFAARFAGMPREEVAAFVDDIFAMTGIKPVGERSADEIVERLAQKGGRSGDAPLSEDIKALLIAALEIDVPLSEAGAALRALIKGAGLKGLDQVLTNFETRKDLLLGEAYQGFTDTAWFATRFGRRFTYYDGFVFELSADDSPEAQDRPFAAGGRYDALLGNLSGGNVDETAIGGIIIPHRLARIAGGAS